MTDKTPIPGADRVRKANAALLAKGGARLSGFLRPDGAAALDALFAAKYAGSRLAVINAALIDAHKKLARGQCR